jgi:hypothetical protein
MFCTLSFYDLKSQTSSLLNIYTHICHQKTKRANRPWESEAQKEFAQKSYNSSFQNYHTKSKRIELQP